MNSEFVKDVKKSLKQTPLNQELPPGSVGRRYDPPGGVTRHNERIHRESKDSDHKNLPFTFRKPPKPKGRSAYVICDNCGYALSGTTATVGIICPECQKFSTVSRMENDG